MYLSEIEIENFRLFGSRDAGRHLQLRLNPGLNVLVGENDSGKTSVIDAVRLLLGTRSYEWYGLTSDDFHVAGGQRAMQLRIVARFRDLSDAEAAAFLEWLSLDTSGDKPELILQLTLEAHRKELGENAGPREREVTAAVRAGIDDEGKLMDGDPRDLLRATYLKPLRDAVQELAAKKGSRLAQILGAHPQIYSEATSDWDKGQPETAPQRLAGIMAQAEHRLSHNVVIQEINRTLNTSYLANFSLGDEFIRGRIGTGALELRQILERMQLTLEPSSPGDVPNSRGLGIHNLLFMATELLLLGGTTQPSVSLVLIEEPEAHLHPQLQVRLVEYLQERAKTADSTTGSGLQVLLTSHSPNLASTVPLANLIVMNQGRGYPMMPGSTQLDASDYGFLERFLDVTKANLFFARGVLIVEGDAEQLLVPALASLIGRSLPKHAVSVVTVGHTGLFRYARIFQRTSTPEMSVRVACLTDRDIPADAAKDYLGKTAQGKPRKTESEISPTEKMRRLQARCRHDGGPVHTFVSSDWTLEHDLALHGLAAEVHAAITLSRCSQNRGRPPEEGVWQRIVVTAEKQHERWAQRGDSPREIAARVYRPLYEKKASKAEAAQFLAKLLQAKKMVGLRRKLPQYLVDAIDYVTGIDVSAASQVPEQCALQLCSECSHRCRRVAACA